MTEISAVLVKELREETNVGMMECKRALVETQGNKAQAIIILRKRGLAIARKKSERAANQGLIASALLEKGQAGSLIEVNCETDFVAKNEQFRAFVQKLAEQAAGADINLAEAAGPEVTAKIAEIGENIVMRRNIRFAVQGTGRVIAYIHHGSTIGVLLEVSCRKTETIEHPVFQELIKDICLHIAASSPRFLDRQRVPKDIIATERDIYTKQIQDKPANIIEKIIDGKMKKFFAQVCLVDQPFVKDQDKTVAALLKEKSAQLDDSPEIRRFARFQVGESLA